MNLLLSAKGSDITSWRAVEDFAAAYRKALLDRVAADRSDSAETIISETCSAVETVIAAHQGLINRLESLITEVSAATSVTALKKITVTFYSDLYRHFGMFHSAPAFYQLSMAFLRETSAIVIAHQLGQFAGQLPEMALIAVGPAGRGEYSPFCSLQILLVHEEVEASQLQNFNLFCHSLHAGFEAAGLSIDPVVTPRNERWRGTLTEWQQRCENGLLPHAEEDLIDLCRLIDQSPLYPVDRFVRGLKQISSTALSGGRSAVTNLINRMTSLSNGLGIMGRLKLERSGRERGMFKLLDHGLLPLSAALSALALIKESTAVGNCERIRDLLKRRELDVELAERMLVAWHCLNNLRLLREQSFHFDIHSNHSLFLNPNELTDELRQSLKDALETVAIIQRHVEIVFSGMGE